MSKRKTDTASDHDEDDSPTTKKRTSSSADSDSVVVCELSNKRKVVVKKFKGTVFVDIREFWSKDGEDFPAKKGISLTVDQWEVLRDHIDDVEKVIKSLK